MSDHADAELITAMGGPVAVAGVFGIAPQAVSAWKKKGIPRPRRMYLELARPDLFKRTAPPLRVPMLQVSDAA